MGRRLPVFQEDKPLVASKDFRYGSKSYETGDPFKWRNLAISAREVEKLFNARRIHHDGKESKPSKKTPVLVVEKAKAKARPKRQKRN